MGLLDEAIREHLELQRKRGADPTEVTRQEHEALGPAVREQPQAAMPAPPEPGHPQGLTGAEDAAASAEATAAPAPEAAPEPELPPAVPDPEAPPHHGPEPGEGLRPDPEAPPPPAHEAQAPPAEPQETVAFDADEIFAEEPPPQAEEEDVLEETPEFLQETPEHDRLWFEQKPPRDFDFDD